MTVGLRGTIPSTEGASKPLGKGTKYNESGLAGGNAVLRIDGRAADAGLRVASGVCVAGNASPGGPRRPAGLPLRPLVEDALGLWLRQGVPVGYGIDGRVVPSRRPACRRDWRWLRRLADVGQDALDGSGFRDEGDDAHVGAAVWDVCLILSPL
jgi:hypothetical protein